MINIDSKIGLTYEEINNFIIKRMFYSLKINSVNNNNFVNKHKRLLNFLY